jgi:hypothetical protein
MHVDVCMVACCCGCMCARMYADACWVRRMYVCMRACACVDGRICLCIFTDVRMHVWMGGPAHGIDGRMALCMDGWPFGRTNVMCTYVCHGWLVRIYVWHAWHECAGWLGMDVCVVGGGCIRWVVGWMDGWMDAYGGMHACMHPLRGMDVARMHSLCVIASHAHE